MPQFAPILSYSGPQMDAGGQFTQGFLSGAQNKRANQSAEQQQMESAQRIATMEQQQEMNSMEIAQARIEQRQQEIRRNMRIVQGGIDILEGEKDEDRANDVFKTWTKHLEKNYESDFKSVPPDFWTQSREKKLEYLKMLQSVGQSMLDKDPRKVTANIAEFQYAQENPEFADFMRETSSRDLSGTEAIVNNLMKEDPSLSYSQALSLAQGLARKGARVEDGKVVPLEGVLDLESDIEKAKAEGELEGSGKISEKDKRQYTREDAYLVADQALRAEKENFANVNSIGEDLISRADLWTTGFMGKAGSYVPGTPQYDFYADLQTLNSDSALGKLVDLKNSSDNGASGLGQVTEREISLLQAAWRNLQQSQSPAKFRKNVKAYLEQRQKSIDRVEEFIGKRFSDIQTGGDGSSNDLSKLTDAEFEALFANMEE